MNTICRVAICIVLLFVLSALSHAEQPVIKPADKAKAAAPTPQTPVAAVPNDDEKTLGDYVPCLMDRKTLYAMRGSVPPPDKVDPNTPVTPKAALSIVDRSSKLVTDPQFKQQYQTEAGKKVDALAQAGQLTYRTLSDNLKTILDSTAETARNDAKKSDADHTAMDKQTEEVKASVIQQTTAAAESKFKRPDDVSCCGRFSTSVQ